MKEHMYASGGGTLQNKKGFTLIELLAVIVILAIIALIATPIVLGIINDARENSRKRSMDNIIHAAELYYMQQQMNGSSTNKLDFDLSDENNGLEYEGERPEGILTIYPGGKIYINAKFDDGSSYTKYPNETVPVKDKKVIGDHSLWQVDSTGRLTKYKGDAASPAILATQNFIMYVMYSGMYATEDRVDENGNTIEEFNKSLKENLAVLENSGEISRTNIPLELNKELDIVIELLDVDHQLTEEELNLLMYEYQDKLPYVIDVAINNTTYGENLTAYKAYSVIEKNIKDEPLIIPNYVKQADGTIQKVTTIATSVFVTVTTSNSSILGTIYDYECSLANSMVSILISEGIEKIESRAFQECGITGIIFPNTLKTIGNDVFHFNSLGAIKLPYSLETIGESAFGGLSGVKGDLIIPQNVKSIGKHAFTGSIPAECDPNLEEYTECTLLQSVISNIYNITFEKGSKIESIGEEAFKGNPITTLTIPKTIKTIGKEAFNSETLKSVIIERAEGDDLSIGENAFGNATITYRP